MIKLRKATFIILIISLLSGSALASATSSTYDFIRTPTQSAFDESNPFGYRTPSNGERFLVHESFTGSKAQLKPIADFFLAQPWTKAALITLDGLRSRAFCSILGFKFGETFVSPRNIEGSMETIRGLTDVNGTPLGTSAGIMDVLASQQVAPELLKAVQETFPDIEGHEWYAPNVGLAVMMGLIGGRPSPDGNGLVFAGDDLVTRAEWMTMLNRLTSYKEYLYDISQPKKAEASPDGVVPIGTWFLSEYNHLVAGDNYLGNTYTLEELSQPVSRAEAAYIFAENNHIMFSLFDPKNPMQYKNHFPDIESLEINPIMKDLLNLGYLMPVGNLSDFCNGLTVTETLVLAEKGEADFPFPLYRAAMNLNLANVLNGFPDGNLYPFEPLTRGQALALLFKAATEKPSGFYDNLD